MSDIVERLRTGCSCDDYPETMCMAVNECRDAFEAAAEIERLRAENEKLLASWHWYKDHYHEAIYIIGEIDPFKFMAMPEAKDE